MNNEGFKFTEPTPETPKLPFEVKQYKEGVTIYAFDNLAVAIDTTGKNYKDLPELFFGPYDNKLGVGTINQPTESGAKIDMDYASECIQKVAEFTGLHKFWFYPFGGDVEDENKDRREKARLRLFQKITPNIEPAPEGHGYILTV